MKYVTTDVYVMLIIFYYKFEKNKWLIKTMLQIQKSRALVKNN